MTARIFVCRAVGYLREGETVSVETDDGCISVSWEATDGGYEYSMEGSVVDEPGSWV